MRKRESLMKEGGGGKRMTSRCTVGEIPQKLDTLSLDEFNAMRN